MTELAELQVFAGATRTASLSLSRDRSLSFGRQACDVIVGPADEGVSRHAGLISFEGGAWRVTNCSQRRTLRVVDHATQIEAVLPVAQPGHPGPYVVLQGPSATIFLDGAALCYALQLSGLLSDQLQPPGPLPQEGSKTVGPPTLTPRQREMMVALAWGYLQPYPAYDPRPATYADVARRVGASEKRVDRHMTAIRARLTDAGIPGLVGLPDARAALVARCLELRLIGSGDIAWLEDRINAVRLAIAEDDS